MNYANKVLKVAYQWIDEVFVGIAFFSEFVIEYFHQLTSHLIQFVNF